MKTIFAIVLIGVLSLQAMAQKPNLYFNSEKEFKKGLELFQKEKFGSAQKYFDKTSLEIADQNSEIKINAEFYSGLCGLELFNPDADLLLIQFIHKYPEHPKARLANYFLGKYYFRKNNFEEAAKWFDNVDAADLDEKQSSEYYFKYGYTCFMLKKNEQAGKLFSEIKDLNTLYSPFALYYYGHIAYSSKNYEGAISSFLKIYNQASSSSELFSKPQDYSNFKSTVALYIAQIYYLQQKYNELISFVSPVLDSISSKRRPEIAHLVGDAYYKTARYNKSIPYLKEFVRGASRVERADEYELAYAYYKSEQCEEAIHYFTGITNKEDSLTQLAYYHMADCYLKSGNKQNARNAFESASHYTFDKELMEDALFSYAKLSYELSFNPYNEAIIALQDYLDKYPNSPRHDEAKEYLVSIYLTTKNYKEALKSIEDIKTLSPALKGVYQKIAFNRSVELFNNAQYDDALTHFDKAIKYPLDKEINVEVFYWNAECYYRKNEYETAIEKYQTFLATQSAVGSSQFVIAKYNIGYAYFKLKDYKNAINAFRGFVKEANNEDEKKITDALLRTADSYFIQKDYENAFDYYSQVVTKNNLATDYALFQKGFVAGLLNKAEQKISIMQNVLSQFPKSDYRDDATYEIAKTYLIASKTDEAYTYYKQVVDNYKNSSYLSTAMLQMGLILYNKQDDQQALDIFKKVVAQFPSTQEAKQALVSIKNISVDNGNTDEFFGYVKTLPFGDVSKASQDSITYEAAEKRYMKGDCAQAGTSFKTYMEKFPDGFFILNASFYKAECDYKMQNYDEALKGYDFVTSKPKSIFTESALVKSGRIYTSKNNCEEAVIRYLLLEEIAEILKNKTDAQIGIMRCSFNSSNYSMATEYAQKLIRAEKIEPEIMGEAYMITAKSYLQQNNLDSAYTAFENTIHISKNELGAEAQYNIANILFLQHKYPECEKKVFQLSNDISSYAYWLAKSFILLSDNYVMQNDTFQARHTLESVIGNYENTTDDILPTAKNKLEKIMASEKTENKNTNAEPMEIELNGDNKKNK